MASIVERYPSNRAISLQSEELVRQMAIGNNWKILSVVLRLGVVNTGANFTLNWLTIGLCSDVTTGFLGTSDMIGARWTGTATYAVNSYTLPNFPRGFRKIGATVTTYTSSSASALVTHSAAAGQGYSAIRVLFFRSDDFASISGIAEDGGATCIDRYTHLTLADGGNTTLSDNMQGTVIPSNPVLTCFSLYWDASTPLEVADITICRLA